MPTALFLSPHLDDVAFSCGATLARLAASGWHCVLATAFTRSVPEPTGFALACQTDKGLAPDVDYMRLRRVEDAEFAHIVRVQDVRWLDLAEAPHRGYRSAAELFGQPSEHDDVLPTLSKRLQALCDELKPQLLFAPLALGLHVDHLQLRRAVLKLGRDAAVAWYRDLPYAMRTEVPAPAESLALPTGPQLRVKLDGCAAYRSQITFQFGSIEHMREALGAFAHDEGRAARLDQPAERFTAGEQAARLLGLEQAVPSPTHPQE